jgi:HSP20 family molecular chaperone IbpA
VDIFEEDQGLVVLADMPGVDPEALDAHVERGVLTIWGKAKHLASGEPISREFQLTGFYRQFQLPEEIDPTRISAELRHGVLVMRLPRAEHALPRRIPVQAA